MQLLAYQYKIKYRSCKQNANADALSLLQKEIKSDCQEFDQEAEEINKLQVARVPIDARLIREETSILSRVLHFTLHGWPEEHDVPDNLKSYYRQRYELTVEDGCLLRGTRVVTPVKHQEAVLSEIHPDIDQIVKSCEVCQSTHGKAPFTSDNPWIWPHRP